MPQVSANGIQLEYETFGDKSAEPILLIMGLGSQMTRWPEPLIRMLVEKGHYVIRYDNRDVGLSSKLDQAGIPNLADIISARQAGKPPVTPYSLDDMALDAVGLLDALKIDSAHIVGVSMGGMIAQLLAADHPTRVRSLTSIMSSSANPALPPAKPEARAIIGTPAPNPFENRDAFLERAVTSARVLGSPGYRVPEEIIRERAAADAERSYYPQGFARQYAAILASPDRRAKLQTITAPSVVLHGEDDALVPVEAGKDTAANIPGAELITVPGMGHDVPPGLFDVFVDAVMRAVVRAS